MQEVVESDTQAVVTFEAIADILVCAFLHIFYLQEFG